MFKKVFLSFLLFGLFSNTYGTHIIGGDFTYRWISGNTFELSLTLYRDCLSATQFDTVITIGVYERGTNFQETTLDMQLISTDSLHLAGSLCSPPPDICGESGTYIKNINLPPNPNGYYLVWERCCRNHSVVNISNPGATGMVFYVEMPDPALHNSSPVFLSEPLPYMCEGQPFTYNFNGFDANGDSLVYELISPSAGNSSVAAPTLPSPIAGPYTDALFLPPYSLANVCGGTPLTVDATTGEIAAVPGSIGIYAMAMEVKEYRNGIRIGLIRREIEFTVIVCDGNIIPDVITNGLGVQPGTHHFEIYETDSICFNIDAHDDVDSLFVTITGDCLAGSGINPPFPITNGGTALQNISLSFCWHTGCGQGRSNPYTIKFHVKDNGCPLPVTNIYDISILIKPIPLIEPLNLLCGVFENDHTVTIYWNQNSTGGNFLKDYVVYRNNNNGTFAAIDTIYGWQTDSYRDSTAFDYIHNNYCYFIQGYNICENTGLSSDTLCTDDLLNRKANYIESVSVASRNKIEMKIEEFADPQECTFYIYRRTNTPNNISNFTLYKTLQGLSSYTWTDTDVNTSLNSYCYYVVSEDPCGNKRPASEEACSILLTGSSVPYSNSIHWSEYINWQGGVFDYEIYRKSSDLVNFSKLTNVEYLVFDFEDDVLDYDHGLYLYQVKAIEGPGSKNAESYSNEVELTQPPLVFAPNAFTPNNDNSNENWEVSTIFIKDYGLNIFNRYGQLVFSTSDKNQSWDGTFHGSAAPSGVYVYEIRYNSYDNGEETRKTGTITLLR